MTRLATHRSTTTAICVWVLGALLLLLPTESQATPRFSVPTLYLSADTLMIDVTVDSLFSKRVEDAIASGMTTSISYEFSLEPVGPQRTTRKSVQLRLDHDIWEGRYQIVRVAAEADTLVTDSLSVATRHCSDLTRIRIATLTDASAPFVLRARVMVNPITPEQEAKTRRWLNLLERGSVLELFFSFEPKDNQHPWSEIARFRKDDLPTDLSPPTASPEPEVSTP